MLRNLRALLNHPAVETVMVTAAVGFVLTMVNDVLKSKTGYLAALDEQIMERTERLDQLQRAVRHAETGEAYPAPADLDPLQHGEPLLAQG